jgi:hypothetical protein
MPKPRLLVTVDKLGQFLGLTEYIADQSFQSSWSHPNVPLLIFSDSGIGASPVTFHGGPIGSALPIEALFWGDWWLSPEGVGFQAMIVQRLQAVIASPYFSELAQYGIQPPHWRGAKVVTRPSAPTAFNSKSDTQAVPDLIDALIDDDVFPDTDDEQIAQLVFMPKGFTQTIGANGAHTSDYNYTFPFDEDYFWVGWVRWFDDIPGESREDVIRTATHELVELFSNPEGDAWYADPIASGEIGDLAVSAGTKQSAFVNGAKVTAYWSNRHNATVIPIDRDYRARLNGTISADLTGVHHGTFRPDPSESRLCSILPSCCLQDRDFNYTLANYDDIAKIRVETERYRAPVFTWMIGGAAVSGNGSLKVNVIAETFVGRKTSYQPRDITVQYSVVNDAIEVRTANTEANFDLTISCAVRDGSITGNLQTDVIAKPSIEVGFVGAKLTLDPEYERERAACLKDAARAFSRVNQKDRHLPKNPGGPVETNPGILNSVPAHARLKGYNQARKALIVAQMARVALPEKAADSLISALVADTPALQAAMFKFRQNTGPVQDRAAAGASGAMHFTKK